MAPDADGETRPNIVLITCHDLGTQLGCYGAAVETPHVDAMAADGIRFDNAFATAPQCSPSRSSIVTGRFPHQNGMMGLAHCGWSLRDEASALPRRMNEIGYETHLFGYQHETDWSHPERLGYGRVHRGDDGVGHPPARALDVANRFSAALPELDDGDPFFASLGLVEPHREFRRAYVPEAAYERYDPEAIGPLPYLDFDDEEERAAHRRELADFRALITATVDPAVGTVREALRERGLAEDTVVVFTTDHGEPFDRAKTTCYDPGLAVSLLVDGPDRFVVDSPRSELISNVDLFATILDLADAPSPDGIESRSLLPLLDGDDYESRNRVYAEQTWHVECKPTRAVRTNRYKYVRNFRPYAERRPGFRDGAPTHEFFDLAADPHERENLIDPDDGPPETYREPFEALRRDLFDWMDETGDPLADGCIPVPSTDVIDPVRTS